MPNVSITAALAAALLVACSDGTAPSTIRSASPTSDQSATEVAIGYGWTRPVTAAAFAEAATKLGSAETVLAGHSLSAIVTNAAVRVRGDDQACVACHAWAQATTRASFCDRVPAFLEQATATGAAADPLSAKPLVLKELLDRWHAAGCPD